MSAGTGLTSQVMIAKEGTAGTYQAPTHSLEFLSENIQYDPTDPRIMRFVFTLVVNPEKMVIKETQRTYTYLNLYGYATDATRTACDYALHERGFDKVTGQVYVHNDASRRVLEKVGFEREGVHRNEAFLDGEYVDVAYYGLLPADFEG